MKTKPKGKKKTMATPPNPLDPVNAAVDKLLADLTQKFSDLTTEISGLKAGIPITQAQIDSLLAKVQGADSTVTNFSA